MQKGLSHILICIAACISLLGNGGIECVARTDTVSICFMGDMMIHTRQIETAARKDGSHDFSSYLSLISDRIAAADIAVANMEFTLAGEPYTGYPCFSAPDSFAEYIAECGFDVFLTANNHIFDKGCSGASRTIGIYRKLEASHGICITGLAENEEVRSSSTPLIICRNGIRIAMINFTYGTNLGSGGHWPKTNYQGERVFLEKALMKAESEADITIALPHWGPEYQLAHSDEQENTAEWLVSKGADLIIGTHPHVVQDTSVISNVQVAYSLGNAVSNMSAVNTQLELMATVRIVRDETGQVEVLPVEFTWLWCSRPGGFCDDYIVIPVEDYMDRRDEWLGKWDYDKMVNTYLRNLKLI